jgi:ribosomal-protein-alanine N-acetyltransferase
MTTLTTERLVLRPWQAGDEEAAAAWHADPRVMAHLGGPLDRAQSDDLLRRWAKELDTDGFGMVALCRRQAGAVIGAVGLSRPQFEAPFTPCIEIGWRLVRQVWGHGLAAEAARAVLARGFSEHGLREVVAFTDQRNHRSINTMRRIGMHRDARGDFLRPALAPGGDPVASVLWRAHADDLAG